MHTSYVCLCVCVCACVTVCVHVCACAQGRVCVCGFVGVHTNAYEIECIIYKSIKYVCMYIYYILVGVCMCTQFKCRHVCFCFMSIPVFMSVDSQYTMTVHTYAKCVQEFFSSQL